MGLFGIKKEKTNAELVAFPDLPDLPELSSLEKSPMEERNSFDDFKRESPNINDFKNDDLKFELTPLQPIKQLPKLETNKTTISSLQGMEKSKFEPLSKQKAIYESKYKTNVEEEMEELEELEEKREEPKRVILNSPPLKRKSNDSVFIRMDKFNTAVSVMNDIKNELNEIERALERTKQIKKQEEIEMEEWEKEINDIRSRLDTIDKTIFNEIE